MPQLRQLEFNGGRSDPRNRRSSSTYDIDGAKDAADENRRCRTEKEPRVQTKLAELNRVLGGGVVPGSLILIGGDPGIGKSTLLLQVSQQLAAIGGTVLYVRRSAEQIKMRAQLRRHRHRILSLWGNGHVRDQ